MHNELVTEVFKKLKKNKLQAVEYDAKQVKKEITDIMNITKSLMSKPEYKEVYKHGMNMSSMSDTMQDKVPENGKYKSGENFWIVRFDLHKFTKCDPRNPENDGYKKHPVEEASEKLKAEVKSLVNKKYPHYDVEVDGDWDTFALEVVLKNGNVVKESSDTEINSEPLMELFGKLKKNKKEKEKWTPTIADKVVDMKDASKYKALFNSTVKFAEDVSRSVIKNVELRSEPVDVREIDRGDYVEIDMFKPVLSLPANFQNLKNQYGDIFEGDKYSDTDGEECCDWVIKKFLNRFKSKGFTKYKYDDVVYNYTKEDGDDEFLYVQFDDAYEKLSVGMSLCCKKSTVKESTVVDDGEPLMELFGKSKKNKKKNIKWTPSEYDKVVDLGDVGKYKSMFNSIVKFAEDVSRNVIKNVKLDTDSIDIKETDKGDYVEIDMFKPVLSLQANFQNLKNQYGDIFEGDEYSDTDGEECCDWVIKKFLNKFKSKGFTKYEYDDVIYNYTKEGKDDEFFSVYFDEAYESLSVGMKIYYKKTNVNVQESTIINSDEPLMELFAKLKKNKKEQHEKKHPLPKKVKEPEKIMYPQDQIVKEIKDVLAYTKKVISKPEYKEFLNKGAELVPFYGAMDMAASKMSEMHLYDEYETNDDFPVIDFDLWDYPKCGARTHEDEGYEVHPVNDAAMKMCTEIREYVYKKYPHYNVEIEGDWDTYSIMLTLK